MDVSSRGLPPLLMDLSKGFPVGCLTHSHRPQPQALDMTKKPEWYHRQPQNCSPDLPSVYRPSSLRSDLNQDPGSFMNSPLTPGLDLYHDQVRSNLWHSGFYEQSGDAGPESSGGEEEDEEEEDSDSDSDVIFLVSSAKEPLLCTSFIQDNVTHIVEPLSPTVSSLEEGRGFYHLPQTVSSPSRDSSYTEESSDSSIDIPIHHARPIVLLSDLSAVYADQSPGEASSDDSDIIEVSVSQSKNKPKERKSNERDARKKASLKVRQSPRRSSCDTPPLTPRRNLRRRVKNNAVGLYNESYDSDDVLDFVARSSSSDESIPPPKNSQRMSSEVCNDRSSRDSTTQEKSPSRSPEREEPPQRKTKYTGSKRKSTPTIDKAKKLRSAKQNGVLSKGEDASVKVKMATKRRKRKRKFKQNGPPSLFPPIEPELALKYAYRKKRERKFDNFSPFVRMEKQACTVVNYHEDEEKVRSRPATSQNVTGFVPTTSCYNLGRIGADYKRDELLKCSLCGQTANVKSLGDLYGPYYLAFSEAPESRTMLNGHLENHAHEEGSERQSKSPKADALENGTPNLEECWVHEDCGVWSMGVFLVRGKLYGLKEAALLAQQTICSCCQGTGAIMGCFQKGCSRNFHFSCAVQSGSVLNEDNFSMRCPDHKNKPCVSRPHLR
uniref:Si:ch211-165g14.1 n=1 Tax=Neogobius melanostomus TaxID=47308 RepID=A0A8C6UPU8_9GOBI